MIKKYNYIPLWVSCFHDGSYNIRCQHKSWRDNSIDISPHILKDDIVDISEFEKHRDDKIHQNDILQFTKINQVNKDRFKAYLEESGLKITKTTLVDKADAHVINFTELRNALYTGFGEFYVVPFNDVYNLLSRDEQKMLSDKHRELSFLVPTVGLKSTFPVKDIFSYPKIITKCVDGYWGANKVCNAIDVYNDIVGLLNSKRIIFDETLNETFGAGNDIDADMYSSIRDMLISDSEEDNKLAFEIISGRDYNSSKLYILFLLNEFNNKFHRSEGATSKNFQSCLKHFRPYLYHNSWDVMVSKLLCESHTDKDKQLIDQFIILNLNKTYKVKFSNIELK